jgi:polyisoprenoid-binding protein YceI
MSAVTAPVATLDPGTTWVADPALSSATFEVGHMGLLTFRAGFATVDATLRADLDGALTLVGRVSVASVTIAHAALREHVLAAEFLDADRHPEIVFRSTAFRRAANGALALEGALTIRGTTNPISCSGTSRGPLEDPLGARRVGLELVTTIDRESFGLTWNAPMPAGGVTLATEVRLLVELELKLQRSLAVS